MSLLRRKSGIVLLLIAGGVIAYWYGELPSEQPLTVDLGDHRAGLTAVAIECVGPRSESVTAQWPAPPDQRYLTIHWQASSGESRCELTLSGHSEQRRVVRRLRLNGQPTLIHAEQAVRSLDARSGTEE